MLIALSQVFETPVSVLLGEAVDEPKADDLKAIAEKLEIINLQMAREKGVEAKTAPLAVHRSVRNYSGGLCALCGTGQPLSRLGFLRSGDRRHGHGFPRL